MAMTPMVKAFGKFFCGFSISPATRVTSHQPRKREKRADNAARKRAECVLRNGEKRLEIIPVSEAAQKPVKYDKK